MSNKFKFVMSHPVCKEGLDLLEGKANYWVANNADPNNYLDQMKDSDAVIIRVASCNAHAIENSPNLKVIGRTGVGFDSVDVKKATELGIPVVITPGANSRSVAEHTVALMFAMAKNLYEGQTELCKGNWKIRDAHKAFELESKTVGIVGFGNIGRITGQICQGIGMKLVAYDPILSCQQIEQGGAKYCATLEELLVQSDFVSIHVPLLDSTRNLIAKQQLSLMKDTACLVNCSRGGIVNEQDLVEALKNKVIAAAALDVFCSEPPKADDPLLTCPNLILSPHSAAQTKEAVIKMAQMCVEGCLAVCEGKKWPHVADPKVYEHEKWRCATWAE
jgi:D-3-phosphoglycerate dehydrogenase / 2-oxoglutarate reductase